MSEQSNTLAPDASPSDSEPRSAYFAYGSTTTIPYDAETEALIFKYLELQQALLNGLLHFSFCEDV